MKVIRECTQIIGTIERGDAAHDLTLEIEKVLSALQDQATAKGTVKGSVTLMLDFAVQGQNVVIEAAITSKVPKVKRGQTFMFLTADGKLSNEHPTQMSMFDGPREVASK